MYHRDFYILHLLLLIIILERVDTPSIVTFKIGSTSKLLADRSLFLFSHAIMITEAVEDIRADQHALHPHVEVDAHLMVVVGPVVLDGVTIQSHKSLQQVMRSVFF